MARLSLLVAALAASSAVVVAQDDFGMDDAGGDGGDLLDLESMTAEGGAGQLTKDQLKKKLGPKLTYIEQTTLALQQLAIVIGVAFMVAFLFMFMIGIEKLWEKVEEKYQEHFGKPQEEQEDPAALVGTFKRYKN